MTIDGLIAWGSNRFLVCGSAGVLQPATLDGRFLVPERAIRDERTSYHYLAPEESARPKTDFSLQFQNGVFPYVINDHAAGGHVPATRSNICPHGNERSDTRCV